LALRAAACLIARADGFLDVFAIVLNVNAGA
jgi:hypothetical protein